MVSERDDGDVVPGNPILDERSAGFLFAVTMLLRILRRAHVGDDGTVVADVVAQKDVQPARVEDERAKALLRGVVDEAAEVDGGVYLALHVRVHTRHGAMVGVVVAKSAPEIEDEALSSTPQFAHFAKRFPLRVLVEHPGERRGDDGEGVVERGVEDDPRRRRVLDERQE